MFNCTVMVELTTLVGYYYNAAVNFIRFLSYLPTKEDKSGINILHLVLLV